MPYLTPDNTPVGSTCWRISIPDNDAMVAAFLGQLLALSQAWNWENIGGITVQETIELWDIVYTEFSEEQGCMIGSITHFINDVTPDNILLCDGSFYARVDYPKLYAVLPAIYIVDPNTFSVPNLQDKFLYGASGTILPSASGGLSENILTEGQLAAHSHTTVPHSHAESGAIGSTVVVNAGAPVPTALPIATVTGSSGVTVDSTGSNDPIDNMPPYTAFKIGIVAK